MNFEAWLREVAVVTAADWKIVASASCVLVYFALKYATAFTPVGNLSGPINWPICGNFFQLGADHPEILRQWSKIYGHTFGIHLGARPIVVINSFRDMKRLFVDLSHSFIDRPEFYTFHRVIISDTSMTLGTSRWNDLTKAKRKTAATALNRKAIQRYRIVLPSVQER